jgi:hypothetical protein
MVLLIEKHTKEDNPMKTHATFGTAPFPVCGAYFVDRTVSPEDIGNGQGGEWSVDCKRCRNHPNFGEWLKQIIDRRADGNG